MSSGTATPTAWPSEELDDGSAGLRRLEGNRLVDAIKPRLRLAGVVKAFTEAMDNVRGEHTHAWLQVDEGQFWLVNFSNMFALGRIKSVKSCHIWIATIEAILRWAGLANDWYVEEVECGSVSGTETCTATEAGSSASTTGGRTSRGRTSGRRAPRRARAEARSGRG